MDPQNVQIECSSLKKVAEAFSVSLSTVRKWRKECPALAVKNKSYNLVDVAFYLLGKQLITADKLSDEIKFGLGVSFACEAIQNSAMARIVARFDHCELVDKNIEEVENAVKKAAGAAKLLPPLAVESDVNKYLEEFGNAINKTPGAVKLLPLLPVESAVIAIASPKSAALFVDRVWTLDMTIPQEIEFEVGTPEEMVYRGCGSILSGPVIALRGVFGIGRKREGFVRAG